MTKIENNAYFGMRNPNFIVDFPENAIFRKIDFSKNRFFAFVESLSQHGPVHFNRAALTLHRRVCEVGGLPECLKFRSVCGLVLFSLPL